MEHQEMIEVLRSKLYGLKLKRDIWVKSGTVLGMPNFIIDDIKALTQAIAILKRVADVEGVMEISHSACEKCHAFSDRRLCGVKKGVCADSAAEISQYLIKGE